MDRRQENTLPRYRFRSGYLTMKTAFIPPRGLPQGADRIELPESWPIPELQPGGKRGAPLAQQMFAVLQQVILSYYG